MSTTPELKYKFLVEYNDGSLFEQNDEDKSETKENGSAFSDVKLDEVKRFSLISKDRVITVDLTDGHFEINGVPFIINDQYFVVDCKLKLIYFREVRIEKNIGEDGSIIEGRHFVNRHFIGWETSYEDKKQIKHTLAVN